MGVGVTNKNTVQEIQESEKLFVPYAASTRLPYVVCDEETYNDQAFLFGTEEELKAFAQQQAAKKIQLLGMSFEKKSFNVLFSNLHAIGVNAVVWMQGEERTEVELEELFPAPDFSKLEPAKRPLLNPALALSGIYYMQAARKQGAVQAELAELQEELLANVVRAEYLLPMTIDPKNPKKILIPSFKDKEGKMSYLFFSDILEYQKFVGKQKFLMGRVPFKKIAELPGDKSMRYVLNPLGFNLTLTKEQVQRLAK
ncbi:MAG: SseB family protein [Blautia sp.]|nr:SseB family protein [Blautia sp.]